MNPLEELLERDRICEVVTRLYVHVDRRDWPRVLDCLAETVRYDIESMSGEKPSEMKATDIVAGWEQALAPLQSSHHQIGNVIVAVSDATAAVSCYGTTSHYLPNESGRNTRTFVGTYNLHLTSESGSWKIDAFRFNLKFMDGNPDLEGTS